MFKALSIQDCKNILQYYKIEDQSCIKQMKHKAVELLIKRLCRCHSLEDKIQYIIHKRYYNSRNHKNINTTKRNTYVSFR